MTFAGRQGRQGLERCDLDDRCFDAFFARADAAAERDATSGWGGAPAIETSAVPRIQRGTSTSWLRTREKPSVPSVFMRPADRGASPAEPANRGPTSVTSELTCS